jgi:hypothetical protein
MATQSKAPVQVGDTIMSAGFPGKVLTVSQVYHNGEEWQIVLQDGGRDFCRASWSELRTATINGRVQRVEMPAILSEHGQVRIVYRVTGSRILHVDTDTADAEDVILSLTRGGADVLRVDGDADVDYVGALDTARRRATRHGVPYAVAVHVGCYGHRSHAQHPDRDIPSRGGYRVVEERVSDALGCDWAVRTIVEPSPTEVR